MDSIGKEKIEIDLLLESIFKRYGWDFRSYARASIDRRVRNFMSKSGCTSISEMIPKIIHDEEFFSGLARNFSVTVTEMFRDPFFYCSLRENVVPLLRTWPHIKIWHAGCATGEEVYSMAIILKEEGLYERSTIYATDFNDESLEKARAGVYEIPKLKEATGSYNEAGGKGSFSEYYHACYDAVTMDPTLKERIVFANHNLVSDSSFGEMHLIVCRNVLIYFDKELKDRALGLFTESLVNGGLLCLGTKEDLHFSSESNHYDAVDKKAKIFRKRG